MLGSDDVYWDTASGDVRTFDLQAGSAFADRDYLMMMGYSGTFPGLTFGTVTVPLTYDFLVGLTMFNPGIIGPGFYGQLDTNGDADASLTIPADPQFMGLTLYIAYAILSPGGALPLLAASNTINMTGM